VRNKSLALAWNVAIVAIVALALLGASTRAAAQQENVLVDFSSSGTGGASPYASLVFDKAGNLYGTTTYGGNGTCSTGNPTGCGTVFELSPKAGGGWAKKVIHVFQNDAHDGIYPHANLILDAAGNLYGTTTYGGSGTCNAAVLTGCGTVFELSRTENGGWAERILHSFGSGKDGPYPGGGVVFDKQGNLYGVTTGNLGSCNLASHTNCGAVYELMPRTAGPWKEKVLHYFSINTADGFGPAGNLQVDADGNLYGGTVWGGSFSNGVAFKLTQDANGGWTEKILYTFYWGKGVRSGGPAGLIRDGAGNLYGVTSDGGDADWGAVFELSPSGDGTWTLAYLHSFNASLSDGGTPNSGLYLDAAGNLYGTTQYGGSGTTQCITFGAGNESASCGVVYRLTLAGNGTWTETVLHNFGDYPDGLVPYAGVIADHAGNLYGTTAVGGNSNGTVFEIKQ
jgi:hypothetical protein